MAFISWLINMVLFRKFLRVEVNKRYRCVEIAHKYWVGLGIKAEKERRACGGASEAS